MTRKPVVVVLHGPSGVGKDTVVDRLREAGIYRPKSSTDRPPREGETGDHYHFYSRDEFLAKVQRGEFVEWAEVYGDLKGLERSELEEALAGGKDIIIRTDVQGARAWREKLPGAVFVIVVPESDEALHERLARRATDTPETIDRRVGQWQQVEKADLPHNDYVIQNREGAVDETVAAVLAIFEAERHNPGRPSPRLQEQLPHRAAGA